MWKQSRGFALRTYRSRFGFSIISFGVWVFDFGVSDSKFGVRGFGVRTSPGKPSPSVPDRVDGLGLGVSGFRVGFRVPGAWIEVDGS